MRDKHQRCGQIRNSKSATHALAWKRLLMQVCSCFAAVGLCAARAQAIPGPDANTVPLATQTNPETLVLDASTAERGLATATMQIPATPGPFTFVYPQWIPGEHGPTGPLSAIARIEVTAHGEQLAWHRDVLDMYAFHVQVPQGASAIQIRFTALLNAPDPMSTHNLAVINWNRMLFYQSDIDHRHYYVKASIILPPGWSYGTALTAADRVGQRVDFSEVSLERLVDSPLDCGRYYKEILLWQDGDAHHWLDLFADDPRDLDVPEKVLRAYRRLTPEALALFGSRHWRDYHSLLVVSNKMAFTGLEHAESSLSGVPAGFMRNPQLQELSGDTLTHEFSHSWNGKYRRPWDLATLNYQIAQRTDLLWVYEGLSQYLGDLLSFRTGIRAPGGYPELLAVLYSQMATEPGWEGEALVDTAAAAPYLYEARGDYPSIRLTAGDLQTEGELLWLDVDTIIRTETADTKSLDTFLHLFSAPSLTGPVTRTYTREDVERLLGQVVPYDWHAFFQRHVYEAAKRPPTEEIAAAGWRLAYSSEPNEFADDGAQWLTYGFSIDKDGALSDVREDSPAWNVGMAPGMKIERIDGRAYSPSALQYGLKESQKTLQPTRFQVSQDGWIGTIAVSYFGGPRYPHLERINGKPDLLAEIMASHAKH